MGTAVVAPGVTSKVPVYLLSDPDLLNNQILAQPEKVGAALDLVDKVTPERKKNSRIVFNMTFNGLSFDRNLLHALSRPPFVAVPLATESTKSRPGPYTELTRKIIAGKLCVRTSSMIACSASTMTSPSG